MAIRLLIALVVAATISLTSACSGGPPTAEEAITKAWKDVSGSAIKPDAGIRRGSGYCVAFEVDAMAGRPGTMSEKDGTVVVATNMQVNSIAETEDWWDSGDRDEILRALEHFGLGEEATPEDVLESHAVFEVHVSPTGGSADETEYEMGGFLYDGTWYISMKE